MTHTLDSLTATLPAIRAAAEAVRELVIADAVLLGEIPAPTGQEEARAALFTSRLAEGGLLDCATDSDHNAFGLLPGRDPERTLLLMTNGDSLATAAGDHAVEVRPDALVGPFVVDNSLAMAAMAVLPRLFEALDIRLHSHVMLLAAARCLGRGNLGGLQAFLAHTTLPVHMALCVETVQLGRLNYQCLGMRRGEIACRLPDDFNWAQYGATGTVIPMNDIINRMNRISLPRRPLTTLILGSIAGGFSHQNIARETVLRFELRGESGRILDDIEAQLGDIVHEVAARSGMQVTLDIFARREPGGIAIGHPLVRAGRHLQAALGLESMLYATTSPMSALAARGIPALTLGLTTGARRHDLDEIDETLAITPLADGLAQVAALLIAMDEGLCDAP